MMEATARGQEFKKKKQRKKAQYPWPIPAGKTLHIFSIIERFLLVFSWRMRDGATFIPGIEAGADLSPVGCTELLPSLQE